MHEHRTGIFTNKRSPRYFLFGPEAPPLELGPHDFGSHSEPVL